MQNFADPQTGTRVLCSAICVDGYEAENITRANSTGFLGANFTKPPVDIYILLPTAVDVSALLVNPRVSGNYTQVLGVFTSSYANDTAPSELHYQRCGVFGDLHMKGERIQLINPALSANQMAFLRPSSTFALPCNRRHLSNVRTIKLRLMKAFRSGCVALKSVEIWGRSRVYSTSNHLVQSTSRLTPISPAQHPPTNHERYSSPPLTPSATPSHASLQIDHIDAGGIPSKFLDPITLELMRDPVLTISGKSVDRSTLTRHIIAQGTDPFTGLPMKLEEIFPDIALKLEIDQYLRSCARQPDSAHMLPQQSSRTSEEQTTPEATDNHKRKRSTTLIVIDDEEDLRPSKKRKQGELGG